MNISTRALLVSTALTLPMAGSAFAQQIEINPDQLVNKSEECQALGQVIADNDGSVGDLAPADVVAAINEDAVEQCVTYVEEIEVALGIATEGDVEAEAEVGVEAEADAEVDAEAEVQLSEEVSAEEQIDIEAEAQALVPAPNVDVQVPGSDVSVRPGTPTVSVEQTAPEIELVQPQPTVSVMIPEILVRVDIPSPNVYVLQEDASVSVAQTDPEVEVQQGEAIVEVTQADPDVTIELGQNAADGSGEGDSTQLAGEGNIDASENQQVGGNVTTARGQPTVQIVQNDEDPQVELSRVGAPSVSYESTEPQVQVEFAQQPSVEIIQGNEPQVTFETLEEREQRRAQLGEQEAAASSAVGGMTVNDILGMEVLTADGDSLGNPNSVIEMDGQQMLVVSSGGFLGLGDTELPVGFDSVTMQDGRIVLRELTEEQIQNAESFEYNSDMALPEDSEVMFGE